MTPRKSSTASDLAATADTPTNDTLAKAPRKTATARKTAAKKGDDPAEPKKKPAARTKKSADQKGAPAGEAALARKPKAPKAASADAAPAASAAQSRSRAAAKSATGAENDTAQSPPKASRSRKSAVKTPRATEVASDVATGEMSDAPRPARAKSAARSRRAPEPQLAASGAAAEGEASPARPETGDNGVAKSAAGADKTTSRSSRAAAKTGSRRRKSTVAGQSDAPSDAAAPAASAPETAAATGTQDAQDAPRNAPQDGASAPEAADTAKRGAKASPQSRQSAGVGRSARSKSAPQPAGKSFAGEPAAESGLKLSISSGTEGADQAAPDTATDLKQARTDEAVEGGRSSSGRGGRRRSAAKSASSSRSRTDADAAPDASKSAPAGAPSAAAGPADFPVGFGDLAPDDFFAAGKDGAVEAESADKQTGKKRRSRSRWADRGRKKAQAAAVGASGTSVADALAPEQPEGGFEEDGDDADGNEAQSRSKEGKGVKARRKMFVSVLPEEQIEVVITEEGQVQEYYVEMLHQTKTKGNIYKATVHNVDPNLQAAFVSYGAVKNGFLQIDEVHPEYYVAPHDVNKGRKYPPIQKVLKPGQELLVQVVKEPAGTKGAFLTTYLSLSGRFLVLTPGREQIGVSRKVDDDGERGRLRELLEGLSPGPGPGVIVRTVSMGASKTSLQRDLQFLKRTWKEVRAKGTTEKPPCLIYQEMDLISRAVRDYLTDAIGEVWINDEPTASTVAEIAEALFPRKKNLVRVHKDLSLSLFERFNLQRQLDQIHSREVTLPSGGRLVIDPTEALTAIDINSGRSNGKNNFEDMAYRTNMEAARMIPLQLRLRDIGGQVVADFIEMRDKSHWREVEKTLRNGMKVDRARYDVGKIGPFGLLEIVRQRLGSSAISISTEPCPCCNGTGVRRNMEWQSQKALRDILRLLRNAQAQNQSMVLYEADQGVAMHLLNHKRQRLLDMEEQYGVHLDIKIRLSAVE